MSSVPASIKTAYALICLALIFASCVSGPAPSGQPVEKAAAAKPAEAPSPAKQADALLAAGKPLEAAELLSAAGGKDNLRRAGDILAGCGLTERAQAEYDRAGDVANPGERIAAALANRGDYPGAIAWYEKSGRQAEGFKALAENVRSKSYFDLAADYYARSGDKIGARASIENAYTYFKELPNMELGGNLRRVDAVAVSRDGCYALAASNSNDKVEVWLALELAFGRGFTQHTRKNTLAIPTGPVLDMQFGPDDRHLFALTDRGREIAVAHAPSGLVIKRLKLEGAADEARRIALSPDGKLAYLSRADGVYAYDLADGKLLRKSAALNVDLLKCSPDGRRLLAATIDGALLSLNANDLSEIRRAAFKGRIRSLSVAADFKRAVLVDAGNAVQLVELESLRAAALPVPADKQDPAKLRAVLLSADASRLLRVYERAATTTPLASAEIISTRSIPYRVGAVGLGPEGSYALIGYEQTDGWQYELAFPFADRGARLAGYIEKLGGSQKDYRKLVEWCLYTKDYEGAHDVFQHTGLDDKAAWNAIGDIYRNPPNKNPVMALPFYEKAGNREGIGYAIDYFIEKKQLDKALAVYEKNGIPAKELNSRLGRQALDKKRFKEAVEYFEKAGDGDGLVKVVEAQYLYNEDEALPLLRKAGYSDERAWNALAEMVIKDGQILLAGVRYQRAGNVQGMRKTADTLFAKKEYQDAGRMYAAAKDREGCRKAGDALLAEWKYEEAGKCFEAAADKRSLARLAEMLYDKGYIESCLAYYAKAGVKNEKSRAAQRYVNCRTLTAGFNFSKRFIEAFNKKQIDLRPRLADLKADQTVERQELYRFHRHITRDDAPTVTPADMLAHREYCRNEAKKLIFPAGGVQANLGDLNQAEVWNNMAAYADLAHTLLSTWK